MHAIYTFDLLTTVSKHIVERLDSLAATPLVANLDTVAEFPGQGLFRICISSTRAFFPHASANQTMFTTARSNT